jgi:hypothetical protein
VKTDELLAELRSALCEHLSAAVHVTPDGRDVKIGVPVTDPYGDALSFILEEGEDGHAHFLTDAGLVYEHLLGATRISDPGADIWDQVEAIAARHGFSLNAGEINIPITDTSTLARSVLNLCATCSECFGLAHSYWRPLVVRFDEEVEHFLRENEIPHKQGETVYGASDAPLRVDFVVNGTRPIVAQAVASENTMRRAVNIFYDLGEGADEFIGYAFVDEEKRNYSNVTFAQLSHKANVVLWSERSRFVDYWKRTRDRVEDTDTRDLLPDKEAGDST